MLVTRNWFTNEPRDGKEASCCRGPRGAFSRRTSSGSQAQRVRERLPSGKRARMCGQTLENRLAWVWQLLS